MDRIILILTILAAIVLPLKSEAETEYMETTVGKGRLLWAIPTLRTDGSALPLNEIKQYQIESACNARDKVYFTIPNASTTSFDVPPTQVGRCLFRINTVDTNGVAGPWSGEVGILFKLNKPQAGGFR